jgi:inosine-uridine nucleoside N-ribohydrolase
MKSKSIFMAIVSLAFAIGAQLTGSCQRPAATPQQSAAPQLVILDTDIGDDIDDAFALALLLRSPDVKLLGVTTAFGDTQLRARLVDRYLSAVGHSDIPVMAGIRTPANNVFSQAVYANHAAARKHGDAIAFLLREIAAHPGKITLIAIGPLFNVQAAIQRDPATFRKLKRVVLMGGSIDRGYGDASAGGTFPPPSPEWNIRCDPAGARALLASGVPVVMLPLDSTQIHLTPEELANVLAHGSPLTDQLTLLYHQWTGTTAWKMPTLFDPVAAATAIRPDLCPTQAMHVDVDDQGFTRPTPGNPNVQVCLKSDQGTFLNFLFERILSDPAQ